MKYFKTCIVIIASIITLSVNAQYVTIPDPVLVDWLQTYYAGCMNGDQLDTTCPAIVNETYVGLAGINNLTSLEGVQYFDNAYSMHCCCSQISYIPPLTNLNSLIEMDIKYNLLTNLPDLPNSLEGLDCQENLLTSLPTLPANLHSLVCDNNNIDFLPVLPGDLYTLACAHNNLSSLPPLPPFLTELSCEFNALTSLPTLPNSLNFLFCSHNQITSIPNVPTSLTTLDCTYNQIASLPPLDGQYFSSLKCQANQLSSLPILPLDMGVLKCDSNINIVCLPSINSVTDEMTISSTSITCLPNYIQHPGYWPQIDTLPLCELINVNDCPVSWNIAGTVFRDTDSLCSTVIEPVVQNIKLLLHKNGVLEQQVFTNGTGNFSFQTSLDTYTVSIDTSYFPFVVFCPLNNTHTSFISAMTQFDTTANFQVQCPQDFDAAAVSMALHSGLLIIGHQFNAQFTTGPLTNLSGLYCGDVHPGKVQIIIPSQLQYIYPLGLAPTNQNGDTLTWLFTDLGSVNPYTTFRLRMRVDTTAQLGDTACITVIVTTTDGSDSDSSNNVFTECFVIGSSYDPNFKETYPFNIDQPSDWQIYTVHFQNTGTAPADNILIKDTLDENLDWSSFQLLGYSHDNLTQVLQSGIVHFSFPNINLPDSNTNEPESHGWIQYRIKTDSTITPGTTIHNNAAIYFDFNDPIITNDAMVMYCVPIETNQALEICQGDSIQVGSNWYSQAGTYTNSFTNIYGCDSVVTTELILTSIDVSISSSTNVITATGGVEYQWYNCDNNQPISGATNNTYNVLQNGNYAAFVTDVNGCSEMSDCVNVTGIGIEIINSNSFTLYPNPATNDVNIRCESKLNHVVVFNVLGQVVYQNDAVSNTLSISTKSFSNGVYFISILQEDDAILNSKFLVHH